MLDLKNQILINLNSAKIEDVFKIGELVPKKNLFDSTKITKRKVNSVIKLSHLKIYAVKTRNFSTKKKSYCYS